MEEFEKKEKEKREEAEKLREKFNEKYNAPYSTGGSFPTVSTSPIRNNSPIIKPPQILLQPQGTKTIKYLVDDSEDLFDDNLKKIEKKTEVETKQKPKPPANNTKASSKSTSSKTVAKPLKRSDDKQQKTPRAKKAKKDGGMKDENEDEMDMEI